MDWEHFTPWASLAGGIAIGIAASMLVLLSGRIAGVSGIVLAGFCPAPAVVAYGAGYFKAVVFVAAMLAGMGIYEIVERARRLRLRSE